MSGVSIKTIQDKLVAKLEEKARRIKTLEKLALSVGDADAIAELKRRRGIPSREPLSPVSRNHGSEIASSATPSMPPPQSATKKAISRAALTAASSILNSKY